MKIRDYIDISFRIIKGHKLSSIIIIVFLTFLLLLGNILINVSYNFDKYINDTVNENILARTYFVLNQDQVNGEITDLGKIIEDLRKFPHIVHSYNQQYTQVSVNIDEVYPDSQEYLTYIRTVTDTFSPNITDGRKVENEDEIICPRYLQKNFDATKTSETIDMAEYLNKELTISYVKLHFTDVFEADIEKEYTKKVKLVGIYDNIPSLITFNECYMLEDVVREMFIETEPTYSEEFLEDNQVWTYGTATEVIVDKVENMELVKEELTEAGYYVSDPALSFRYDVINRVNYTAIIGFIVLLYIILIVFNIYVSIFIRKNKNLVALFKTFGYSKRNISIIFLLQILSYLIISFILSLILANVVIVIGNNIISSYLDYFYVSFRISYLYELLFVVLLLLIILISYFKINRVINKYSILEIFYENNI